MDHQIATLLMRGRVTFVEKLCLQSFVDAGHHVLVYAPGSVDGLPDGIELRPLSEIVPGSENPFDSPVVDPAFVEDVFRYRLLSRRDRTIWVVPDVYCRSRLQSFDGHLHGWESPWQVGSGVLALPGDSPALASLIDLTSDVYSVPPFCETGTGDRDEKPVHVTDQPAGVWGARAITHYLRETGEIRYTRPGVTLFPTQRPIPVLSLFIIKLLDNCHCGYHRN